MKDTQSSEAPEGKDGPAGDARAKLIHARPRFTPRGIRLFWA